MARKITYESDAFLELTLINGEEHKICIRCNDIRMFQGDTKGTVLFLEPNRHKDVIRVKETYMELVALLAMEE